MSAQRDAVAQGDHLDGRRGWHGAARAAQAGAGRRGGQRHPAAQAQAARWSSSSRCSGSSARNSRGSHPAQVSLEPTIVPQSLLLPCLRAFLCLLTEGRPKTCGAPGPSTLPQCCLDVRWPFWGKMLQPAEHTHCSLPCTCFALVFTARLRQVRYLSNALSKLPVVTVANTLAAHPAAAAGTKSTGTSKRHQQSLSGNSPQRSSPETLLPAAAAAPYGKKGARFRHEGALRHRARRCGQTTTAPPKTLTAAKLFVLVEAVGWKRMMTIVTTTTTTRAAPPQAALRSRQPNLDSKHPAPGHWSSSKASTLGASTTACGHHAMPRRSGVQQERNHTL